MDAGLEPLRLLSIHRTRGEGEEIGKLKEGENGHEEINALKAR